MSTYSTTLYNINLYININLGKKSKKVSIISPQSMSDDTSSQSSKISTSYLEGLLDQLKSSHNRKSTRTYYHNVWTNFNKFIIRLDRMPKSWEQRTSLYCAYLICEKQLQSSTVKSYVSAIKDVLQTDGYKWNDGAVLLNTLTRSCKLKNDQMKTRLPIQKGLLELILFAVRRKYGDSQVYLEAMYISAYLISYHGLMRVGEICLSQHSIRAIDIHESRSDKKLLLILYSSKTHGKESRPQKIKILGKRTVEVTNSDNEVTSFTNDQKTRKKGEFCPYEWAKLYIEMRPPIVSNQEQFFIFQDRSPLKACQLRRLLKETIQSLGLDQNLYDTHSFRIGRATDLFKSGVDIDNIKQLGRWKSNAVYKYLRE